MEVTEEKYYYYRDKYKYTNEEVEEENSNYEQLSLFDEKEVL